MIDINKLVDDDIGREVKYTPFRGGGREIGKIIKWNDTYIFVRYHTKINSDGRISRRYGETGEATKPEQLEFID